MRYTYGVMPTASEIVRDARRGAFLTQAQMAARLGTTQSAVARLEAPGANPTVETLERALEAAGRRLELHSVEPVASLDETLIDRQLRLSPAERVTAFMTAYENVRRMIGGATRGGVA